MHKYFFKFKKFIGLSLIEILVTITIVLILCSASIYTYQDYKITALYNSALNTIQQNILAVSSYYAKNKACPPTGFIGTQNLNAAQSIASSITSDSTNKCDVNLNGTGGIILTFKAIITPLGDLQYYCTLGPGAPSNISTYVASCPTNPVPTGNPP